MHIFMYIYIMQMHMYKEFVYLIRHPIFFKWVKDLNWLHKEDNKIANEQMKECSTGWLSEKCELKL